MDNKVNTVFNNTVKIIISVLLFIAIILGLALKKPKMKNIKPLIVINYIPWHKSI